MPEEIKFVIKYDKKKVIQALRYHFISRNEIRILIVLINVFAIFSAILFGMHKISPYAFLLSSFLWVLLMASFWMILPIMVYSKSPMLKQEFLIAIKENHLHLENEKGYTCWNWNEFIYFIDSPNFFHLYFNNKSFFLVPKYDVDSDVIFEIRKKLIEKIGKK